MAISLQPVIYGPNQQAWWIPIFQVSFLSGSRSTVKIEGHEGWPFKVVCIVSLTTEASGVLYYSEQNNARLAKRHSNLIQSPLPCDLDPWVKVIELVEPNHSPALRNQGNMKRMTFCTEHPTRSAGTWRIDARWVWNQRFLNMVAQSFNLLGIILFWILQYENHAVA